MKKIILSISLAAFPALAASGVKAAKNETKSMLRAFKKGDLAPHTQRALNALVQTGIEELRKRGFENQADTYQMQWERDFADFLTRIRGMDLGDHMPLSQWLADFYKELQAKLGDMVLKALGLTDIPIFNYGIPVAFQPKGDKRNGDTWDMPEYGLHFVPLAGAVAAQIASLACKVASHGTDWGQVCGPASALIRWVVTKFIAPPLSDYVYTQANKKRSNGIKSTTDFATLFEQRLNESVSR